MTRRRIVNSEEADAYTGCLSLGRGVLASAVPRPGVRCRCLP
jgi:hypothetical protein